MLAKNLNKHIYTQPGDYQSVEESYLEIKTHHLFRFKGRTGQTSISVQHTLAAVEADLATANGKIPWRGIAYAIRTMLGLHIVVGEKLVTFLSWDDLPPRKRQVLQSIALDNLSGTIMLKRKKWSLYLLKAPAAHSETEREKLRAKTL